MLLRYRGLRVRSRNQKAARRRQIEEPSAWGGERAAGLLWWGYVSPPCQSRALPSRETGPGNASSSFSFSFSFSWVWCTRLKINCGIRLSGASIALQPCFRPSGCLQYCIPIVPLPSSCYWLELLTRARPSGALPHPGPRPARLYSCSGCQEAAKTGAGMG